MSSSRPNYKNSADSNEDMALSSFQLLTENDMRDIIQRSARKSYEFDPMPTSLVLSCLDELLPVIMRMVNSTLACGYFPSDWKEALVNPLLKKDDLPHVFANLRPVSNLQFISKLTQIAVFNQVHRHMTHRLQGRSQRPPPPPPSLHFESSRYVSMSCLSRSNNRTHRQSGLWSFRTSLLSIPRLSFIYRSCYRCLKD